jgi:DNA polymerase I-like protein with 3'-5' exonuclease and polymerase domains
MANVLALDTETTTFNKGNPYDSRNSLVCISFANNTSAGVLSTEDVLHINVLLPHPTLLVGFNFKFDYHWLSKYGIDLSGHTIWDVQIAEFLLSNQTNKFPSLNETCEKYGIPVKKNVVKEEYWDKGINTDQIPWDILSEYAEHDAVITLQCYHAQLKLMSPAQIKLCFLMGQDLYILREMEGNGIPFDEQLCYERSLEVNDQISTLKQLLSAIYPNVPINFGSNDHLSAFLYGGVVKEDGKESVGFYKTGIKAGQPKYKNIVLEHLLPRLYEPLKGSEMVKEGNYSVDSSTLRKLKGKKATVEMLLELSKLEKLNGTYYKGLVSLREEMHWPKNILHGQFNQCTTTTGRLSSSRPNLQNFSSELQDIFISEF